MEDRKVLVVGAGSRLDPDLDLGPDAQVSDPDPVQDGSYDDGRQQRLGNNRKHAHKKETRAKRRAAKVSQRKNRK